MDKLIDSIKSQIPVDVDGFSCIKTQNILIPYMEIGIECLIRNISNLNLFFETILKLIEIQVNDILEITDILGVTYDITKEAIVDMVALNFISISENKLRVTDKGKEALKTQKQIEIKKKYLNKVMINLVNGKISDGYNTVLENANKRSVCLVEEITVDKQFLDANYQMINQVFKEQQEKDSAFGKNNITKELYKIVDIHYNKLVYVNNEVFIYKSEGADEIQMHFKSDHNNEYLSCLYNQLKQEVNPCLEYFFERNRDLINTQTDHMLAPEEMLVEARNVAKEELKKKDDHNMNLDLFKSRRYSFSDKEYINYFIFSDEIIFDRLIIYTNRINNILTKQVFQELNRILKKKTVVIIYDKDEFRAKENLEYFLGNTNINLFVIPSENVKKTLVFFESSLKIEIEQRIIKAFNKSISYLTAIIDFKCNKSDSEFTHILSEFNIDSKISQRKNDQVINKPQKKRKKINQR
ncbi:MAG: hypothetical protein CVU99_13460 [Firmicutes bacterium HGW-Firmicutes-4]|jgi:hypothetical protein|uniref:Uncharacterized protein n=1 Tax=Acetobacterium malicum TaxID=52692 RepID=A0ABR6YXC9_9FIRM|nr:hypothetical protein [Acetobacterium malicum]MBC3899785.1 hypothetical protein [Acetobacterium malicum]PKM54110.1 MAG: hypothetical protein CVV00_09595 [Firmicutes bacterium HGW-Firmicutes-5]PKM57475.1 MAG: hypothetical protein CVU98_05855 [Firmicutes bacterium HGW-Firmicutes-3]PKM59431.1 MAG: hypothetical protein CVU99_13460 [Firmicutes bacterium HGW-Firmicutes-4]